MAYLPRYNEDWQRDLVRSKARRHAAVEAVKLRESRERTVEEWQRIVFDMLTFPLGWEPPESKWSGLIEQQALFKRARR